MSSAELPGAFPSEDAIVRDTQHDIVKDAQHDIVAKDAQLREASSLQQQPITTTQSTTTTTTTGPGSQSAHTAALTTPAVSSTTTSTTDAPDFTENVKAFAGEAMTAAAAFGLAAKDAAIAAKDAAMPVVNDAAVAARDTAAPAANIASEKAVNAAGYAKESAVNMADTARANAPNALSGTGNTTSHNAHPGSIDETSTGIPTEVRDSIIKSGRAPEAAGDWQAVQDKHKMENELLHSVHKAEAGSGDNIRSQNQGTHELGSTGSTRGTGHEAHRPVAYTQDTSSSFQTPGTAVVLGTDTERAFPLGVNHNESERTPTSSSVPDFADTPSVTTGLETRETRETSDATGRGDYAGETGSRSHAQEVGSGLGSSAGTGSGEYTHESGAGSYAEDVGSGYGSRKPTSSHGPLADLPLREIQTPTAGVQLDGNVPTSQRETADRAPVRESTDSTGSGPYKTLSSGTPSGVQM